MASQYGYSSKGKNYDFPFIAGNVTAPTVATPPSYTPAPAPITSTGPDYAAAWRALGRTGDVPVGWRGEAGQNIPGATPATTATTGGDYDITSLASQINAGVKPAYEAAIKSEESRLPLIQERYKALADELRMNRESEQKKIEEEKMATIGETRARAATQGVYGGTTELGGEEMTRRWATEKGTEALARETLGKSKYNIAQAEEENVVADAIRKLGVSQAEAQQSGLKDAISSILAMKKEQREAEMQPYDLAYKTAQIQKALEGPAPKEKHYTTVQVGDKLYSYDPDTGQLVGEIGPAKSQYTENDVSDYANNYVSGEVTASQIPVEIRGQVLTLAQQIKDQRYSTPVLGGIQRFLNL